MSKIKTWFAGELVKEMKGQHCWEKVIKLNDLIKHKNNLIDKWNAEIKSNKIKLKKLNNEQIWLADDRINGRGTTETDERYDKVYIEIEELEDKNIGLQAKIQHEENEIEGMKND